MTLTAITHRIRVLTIAAILAGAAVVVPDGHSNAQAACGSAAADGGTATATVTYTLSRTANYLIWARVQTAADADSLYLQVDGNCPMALSGKGVVPHTWTWVPYVDPMTGAKTVTNLTAGSHTFVMSSNSAGLLLDRIILATNTACVPTGMGNNCGVEDPASTPAPTGQPTVTPVSSATPVSPAVTVSPAATTSPSATPRPVGDINGDGKISILDLSIMLSKWGTAAAAADLNGDGKVGILDLSLLLSRWS